MRSRLALLGSLGLLALPLAASADTLTVPGDHATIQAAVDAASAGDVILVTGGPYAESVVIDGRSDLTLRGGDPAPVLDGSGTGIPLTIRDAAGIHVEFFTIQNSSGSVVRVVDSSDVSIADSTVRDSDALDEGDGVHVENGDGIRVERVRFEGIEHDCVALSREAFETPTVNSLVSKNDMDACGDDGVDMRGDDNVVEKNRIASPGGDGVDLQDGMRNLISKNRVSDPGAHGVELESTVSENRIEKNTVDRSGSSAYFASGDRNHFEKNKASRSAEKDYEIHGDENVLVKNRSSKAGTEGMRIAGDRNALEKNRVSKSGDDAFDVEGDENELEKNFGLKPGGNGYEIGDMGAGVDNDFVRNKVVKSKESGFRVASAGNTFVRNVAVKSSDYDLRDDAGAGANTYDKNKFKTTRIAP